MRRLGAPESSGSEPPTRSRSVRSHARIVRGDLSGVHYRHKSDTRRLLGCACGAGLPTEMGSATTAVEQWRSGRLLPRVGRIERSRAALGARDVLEEGVVAGRATEVVGQLGRTQ